MFSRATLRSVSFFRLPFSDFNLSSSTPGKNAQGNSICTHDVRFGFGRIEEELPRKHFYFFFSERSILLIIIFFFFRSYDLRTRTRV